MRKLFSFIAAVLFAGSMMATTDTIFTYNGKGVTTAEAIVKKGGTLTPYGQNSNIVADQKQKGNMCIKINKGFTKDGIYYYMAITLDQPLQAGDKITTAAFRTGTSDCIYGMDFNAVADSASATDACQVLFDNNLQVLSSDGVPADTTFEVPAAAAGARFIRLYRKSGSTGLWIANFTIIREGGVTPPAPEHTYTVAGGSDVLFGTTWAPANTANDMTLVEGLYTWEKTELTLAAGNIEFKVCEDHAWTNCWPSENYQLNIAEAGIYTVTITFNAETKEVAAVATKTGEAVVIPTVAMHGNFLGSWADTENFAVAQDNASASLTLTLAEGNYEFGMRIGGSGNWTANGAAFTRENNSAVVVAGSGNLTLAADLAGEYTFTWTFETNTLTITYPAEAPVITTYEVAEAIAAGLAEDTEIQVRGIITKMEFKGKNFAKYGSVNIYVADATDAEGEFEFFNCYSLNADTFKTSTPAYDATSTAWEQFTEVVDANGNAIHVGDTVIAFGKYTLYNNTVYELKQGCYLVDVKAAPVQPAKEIVLEMNNGKVSNEYIEDYGSTDVILFNIPVTDAGYIEGDGDYLDISIFPEDPNDISGTYTVENEGLDIEYTWLMQVAGTDTTNVEFVDGNVVIAIENAQVEEMTAELKVAANLTSVDGDTYIVTFDMVVYYDFIEEEQGIEDVAEDQKKAIKRIETGNVIIEKNGVRYNLNGQQIR